MHSSVKLKGVLVLWLFLSCIRIRTDCVDPNWQSVKGFLGVETFCKNGYWSIKKETRLLAPPLNYFVKHIFVIFELFCQTYFRHFCSNSRQVTHLWLNIISMLKHYYCYVAKNRTIWSRQMEIVELVRTLMSCLFFTKIAAMLMLYQLIANNKMHCYRVHKAP